MFQFLKTKIPPQIRYFASNRKFPKADFASDRMKNMLYTASKYGLKSKILLKITDFSSQKILLHLGTNIRLKCEALLMIIDFSADRNISFKMKIVSQRILLHMTTIYLHITTNLL